VEIAGGESAQIQDGQHLDHLGRTPHVRRPDAAAEALALALLIAPAIVDPRRPKSSTVPVPKVGLRPWDRSLRTTSVRPRSVALVTMALHLVCGFRIQRRHQYPPRCSPRDLLDELPKFPACFP
jgi:hypothetical protein